MLKRLAVFASSAVVLACLLSPVGAEEPWYAGHGERWRATQRTIYALENLIARLEADPAVDDGYKAPIISKARADILRLRATLRPAVWRWTDPCCYSRRPTYIR
jgi:hypothetical protein